jgi:DNA repair exonuclease SbcCD ATPase subunit
MTGDDILARIPDLVNRLRADLDPEPRRTQQEAAAALEAAHARIASLEAEVELLDDSAEQVKELEAERDLWKRDAQDQWTRAELNANILRGYLDEAKAEAARYLARLKDARAELARWGWGDYHYGTQPQDQAVTDCLARIDADLAAAEREPGEGHRCGHCGKPMIYLDSADEYVHTFAADAEACFTEREPSE